MGSPDSTAAAQPSVHWAVTNNYRLRTGSFAIMFVSVALHGWDKAYSPALWGLIALQLLAYPHLMYWRARHSSHSEQAEANNLLIDSLLFGLLMATLEFPLWISFTVYIASTLNITLSRGIKGMLMSQLAFATGALISIATLGWNLSPATDWPTTLVCLLGNAVYMVSVGQTAYRRNQQLRLTRESLRQSQQTLTQRLRDIEQLQAKLQEQATRDPLTGLYNRRFLDTIVEREIARCHRDNLYMVVMMMDVDHFKHVNDTHGHPGGDAVLQMLSSLLLDKARATDVPCRYGGEEFLLLLPGMTADIGMVRANQWRARFAETATVFGEASIHATMSVGVAVYPTHGETLQALTHCADLALYRAKEGGRNRVVMYDPTMEH